MLNKRNISLLLIVIFVLSVGLIGCGSNNANKSNKDNGVDVSTNNTSKNKEDNKNNSNGSEPKYGGIYKTYFSSDFNTLDPAFATADSDGRKVSLIYDSLIRFDPEGKLIPSLAKSWETPDDKTYIFTLVENAKFHNGNPFTAKDVKYSFERVLNPKVGSPRTWVFEKVLGAKDFKEGKAQEVKGIEVIEDYKVKITLAEPFAPFLSMLGMPAAHIVDKNEVEKYTDPKDYALKPVGTGPYVFEEYTTSDRFVVKANKDYFMGRPYLDGIEHRFIKDGNTQVAEFEAGNMDELQIPSADLERIINNPTYKPYIHNNNTFWNYYIGLTYNRPPFDDVRVRQAFNYAIDRPNIIKTVKGKSAVISQGPVPPGLDGYRDNLDSYPYNQEKAKELIKEAGYSTEKPCKVEFFYSDSAENVALLEPIQAQLNQVGFDVKLTSMEWSAYRKAIRDNKADAFYLSWGADYPDAENYLYPLFHSSCVGGGGNETFYNNSEVDKLLEEAHRIKEYKERIELYHKIEDITIEDAARVWLYLSVNWYAYKPEVKGIVNYRIFNADKMTDIWLDR